MDGRTYADLQPGLELNPNHLYSSQPEVAGGDPRVPEKEVSPDVLSSKGYTSAAPGGERGRRTILGLSVLVFWSLVVLLFVILAAGIGGGVGAGLAARKTTCAR